MAVHQVEPQDATFLYIDRENRHTHVSVIWIYGPVEAAGGGISRLDIQHHLQSRLHINKVFYQKLVRVPLDLDYPYWVDDEHIEFSHHVREVSLPAPGDWARLMQAAAEIHSRALDLDKPLWEVHLIRGLRIDWLPEGAFALLAKFHHVALDGETGITILKGLHDLTPGPISAPDAEPSRGPATKAPGTVRMLAAAALNHLNFSIKGTQALAALATRLPKILSTVRLQSLLKGSEAPDTLFNKDVSIERVVDCRFFDFSEIKQIQYAVPGATVNDVVLAICGGALRRFLESRGELPDTSMVTVCPINVRTPAEAESGGNRIAMMTTRIHTDIADPLERLKAIHRSTKRAKATIEAVGAREIQELNNSLPSVLQTLAIAAVGRLPDMPRPFNTSISNLPGPRESLYLGGAKLLHIGAGMPIGDGYGLFIGICTYAGQISFNVTSAVNILPQPQQLMVQFEHAVAELKKATAGGDTKVRPRLPRNTAAPGN